MGEILKKYIDTIVILSLSKANGNEFKFQVLKHRFKKSLKSFMLLNQCSVALELERGWNGFALQIAGGDGFLMWMVLRALHLDGYGFFRNTDLRNFSNF